MPSSIIGAFLSLSNAGDLVTDTFETANNAWSENNALVEEAEKRYATTDSQVEILKNKFSALKDDMGRTLIPAFIKLVDILGKFIGFLERHPTLTKFAVAGLAIASALAVIVGPFIVLVALLPMFVAGIAALKIGMVGLLATLTPILGPIIAISAAILGIVAAVKLVKGIINKSNKKKLAADQAEFARLNPGLVKKSNIINLSGRTPSNAIDLSNPRQNGSINLTIQGDVIGTDPDDMAEAFAEKMDKVIRL